MYRIQFNGRTGIPLHEDWGLLPDPMGRCRRQHWWNSERTPGDFFPSYDTDAFWPTTVPASFMRVHPELAYYEGEVIYQRYFSVRPPADGERAFLHFEGVADRAAVYLNGQLVGENDGACNPFTLDVTAQLAAENRLLLLVDNRRQTHDVPGEIHDWYHDGGITRPVSLHYLPTTYLREVALSTRLDGDAVTVSVRAMLSDPHRGTAHTVCIALRDPADGTLLCDGEVSAHADAWATGEWTLTRDALRLWSPDDPYRYALEVSVGAGTWRELVGLREVRTEGRDILLNGAPVILRGVCGWMDTPSGPFTHSPESAARLMDILRDLGCNFLRAGHMPPSRALVEACDRAGMLVWSEVPAYWIPTMHQPLEKGRALAECLSMLRQNRNAASVIIWSIGNECVYHDQVAGQSNLAYFLEAADLLHELDPSRLVAYTGGFEGAGNPKIKVICPDALVERLDVIGINSYAGITDGVDPDRAPEFDQHWDKLRAASALGKPVLLAEVGIDAVRGETGFDYGEARQADYHAKIQRLLAEAVAEGVAQGTSLFVLCDFKTPIKLGRFQRGFNRKGLLTETGEPKAAYYAVQQGFHALAEATAPAR